MKNFILLFILTCGVLLSYSQVQPGNMTKHKMSYKGYTIYLLPSIGGTFGYDIVEGRRIVLHQEQNPFTGSAFGLRRADDVFKVAQWQIDNRDKAAGAANDVLKRQNAGSEKLPPLLREQLKNRDVLRQPIRSKVPMSVARDLHIKVDSH